MTSAEVQLSVVASAPASASGSQLRRPMAQGMQVTVGRQALEHALPLLPSHPGSPSRKTQVPLLLFSPQVRLHSRCVDRIYICDSALVPVWDIFRKTQVLRLLWSPQVGYPQAEQSSLSQAA